MFGLIPTEDVDLRGLLHECLPPTGVLDASLAVERLLSGCACGNPVVLRDRPCSYCGELAVPTHAPDVCPRCGVEGRIQVAVAHDPRNGEVVFRALCHGAVGRATMRVRLSDVNDHRLTMERVAQAVAAAIADLGGAP